MTIRSMAALASVALMAALFAGVAEARNPHCAGGIQYVVQAMRDKDKGNAEDYQREIQKAVAQLEQCSSEDPADLEALGYLGWAYAEVESAGPAGVAFQKAIVGLKPKDPKKADWVRDNRDSYWANKFNDGISKINAAQEAYPDFSKAPENDADKTLHDEAAKNYKAAITSLTKASLIKPGSPQTMRNLGSVYAFMGDFKTAESVFREGLKDAPGDSALTASLKSVRTGYAAQLLDQKKYDEAVAFYSDLQKSDPNSSDLYLGQADAYFKRASDAHGDGAKPDYKLAGGAYAKAASLKSTDADLPFNAALSYQNAGEWALAEAQWRACLKLRPNDVDAMSALGQCLSEQKKYDEAVKALQAGVMANPKNKVLHRQLGAVYTRMQNNLKSTEELMVYLALQNGTPVADAGTAAKAAPAGSAASKTLSTMGVPEEIIPWEVDQQKIESWFYWSKSQAYHFQNGTLYGKSDWSTTAAAPTGKK
ncbi:MAG: tetratricopeptide repeat protein [Candidatus Eiseniibacteriota bacterium]